MSTSLRAARVQFALWVILSGGVCAEPEAPDGYRFAVNGTHVEKCVGSKCPTMWAETPSPNNCGGGFEPTESYIVHQRGADWDGIEGEAELHGQQYELAERLAAPGGETPGTVRAMHNQSVILQCCPAVAPELRPTHPGAFIDMKACPDQCDAADGKCPITLGDQADSQTFGKCKSTARWLLDTDRCDLQVVEAGWRDPHAPLGRTNGNARNNDKRVFNLVYRAAWTCGDGFCDVDEKDSCASDCPAP